MTPAPALFGYAPGRSWLHGASPLPKLAWLLASLPLVLLTFEPAALAAMLVGGGILVVSSGTGRIAARTLVALAPIGAGVVVLQALAPVACATGPCTPVAGLGPLTLYAEGVSFALVLVARLAALELLAVALLATTHPSDLFGALRRIRLPYEVALMAMLSIQLVPELGRELREVLAAQRARGLRGSGIRALVPTLVPVVAGAFDRLTSLVLSLEARGLGAGRRTSYRRVALGPAGAVAILAATGAGVGGSWFAATHWGAAQAAVVAVPGAAAALLVASAAAVFVVVVAAGISGLARG